MSQTQKKGFRQTAKPKGKMLKQNQERIQQTLQFLAKQLMDLMPKVRENQLNMDQIANLLKYDKVTDSITNKDTVMLDLAGRVEVEEGKLETFKGGFASGFVINMGENSLIPGFEDQLMGAKVGEELVVQVTFPEEYPVKDLQNKKAEFDVKILGVWRNVVDPNFSISAKYAEYLKSERKSKESTAKD